MPKKYENHLNIENIHEASIYNIPVTKLLEELPKVMEMDP